MLLSGLGSVRIGKNCDLGLENAALGLRPRAAFSRPQFFPIRTSQPANNIYILTWYSPAFLLSFYSFSFLLYQVCYEASWRGRGRVVRVLHLKSLDRVLKSRWTLVHRIPRPRLQRANWSLFCHLGFLTML